MPITHNEVDLDPNEATYVVFDVETTGLSAIYNDLIQVALLRCTRAMSLRSLMSLSIQAIPVSLTTQLTGITNEHVRGAKPWYRSEGVSGLL